MGLINFAATSVAMPSSGADDLLFFADFQHKPPSLNNGLFVQSIWDGA